MSEVIGGIIKGSEINTIEMYETIRITMLELLKGYPAHIYWGIFEGRFKKGIGEEVVRVLEKHKLIEAQNIKINNELKKAYRLTPKGIDVAISLAQLKYAEKMSILTKIILVFTITNLIFIFEQVLITLFS